MSSAGEPDIEAYLRFVRTTVDSVGRTATDAVAMLGLPEAIAQLVLRRWTEEISQPVRFARVISSIKGGKREWFKQYDPAQGYYWRRLRAYLIDKLGRSDGDVRSLDDATDKVLAHLEDPRPTGPAQFRVQGLVVGYVQSGKTANFSALISKAADAGYKLVIVLSGIHNELRRQTQLRLNREFGIGDEGKKAVGEPEFGKRWVAITQPDVDGDFREGTFNAAVLQGNERVLAVVKKNAMVLRRLIAWMRGHVAPDMPVLVVDDEADQASINTGGNRPDIERAIEEIVDLAPEDRDAAQPGNEIAPAVINGLIRDLLQGFHRVSFVAYTATPFANVLIGHDAVDRDVGQDLYPRDFIVTLPKPAQYFGAERLFGRDPLPGEDSGQRALDVIRFIPDAHKGFLVPAGRAKADTFQPRLPPSLRDSLLDFILGLAARYQRGMANAPACMLIHTHYRTVVQFKMRGLVHSELQKLRDGWRYDDGKVPGLRERWESDFRRTIAAVDVSRDAPFDALKPSLDQIFRDPMTVLLLNSGSDDVLDYEANPGLQAVVIGGNRLSRGLTLEGLLVSYFLRDTHYYDTLLQMGRWFGYRGADVDLTRLHTTHELMTMFRDLALAEEELRYEIIRYERESLTPMDFGPKIRLHPAMMVTARNKMGAGQTIQQSYSGRLLSTVSFKLDDRNWLQRNLEATRELLRLLGDPEESKGGFTWSRVEPKLIETFLDRYQTPSTSRIDPTTVRGYIAKQVERGELTRWRVSVRSLQRDDGLGVDDLGIAGHPRVNLIARSQEKDYPGSIKSLINPASKGDPYAGDEVIGLDEEAISRALEMIHENPDLGYGDALRRVRNPEEGLLLIYPISPKSTPKGDSRSRVPLFSDPAQGCTVIGVSLCFPESGSDAAVEYVANLAGFSG